MKNVKIFLLMLALSSSWSAKSQAEEYLLSFNRNCSTEGKDLNYACKKSSDPKYYIYEEQGTWKVRTFSNQFLTDLKVLRNDENILVLEQETVYSGNQIIYIMKPSDQFYLIQVAYSEILKNNESTTKQGIYIKTKK